ncbi:predicted protein [Aspergillus terreus NIH2624]|uniref:Uncharacterized protein n=1 Tax=Aspergillus terreus (strain NIH 2624 / FGSC A1156) TaxID=341663 RepID=Q0CDM5_ASPTN|nr:uncharacterized protein ATEG_08209 [Aspergillus terreus NIH2624]EAU31382.1 predicted protein [Aspergillus terreus NIH2624]
MASELPTRGTKRKSDDHEHPPREIKPDPAGVYDATLNPLHLADLSEKLKILPVPEDGDTLEETAAKLCELAKVVSEGNSVALWTGLQLSSSPHARDPETMAKAQMTPQELTQYEAWQAVRQGREVGGPEGGSSGGLPAGVMRAFDWDANLAPMPGAQSEKRFRQRAAAMDVIWDHQCATPEHAVWLTFHMVEALPLVKAVTKVMNVKRHFGENDPYPGLTGMEVAELETVRKIVSVAERNRTRELERIRRLTRSINDAAATIRTRLQVLERS